MALRVEKVRSSPAGPLLALVPVQVMCVSEIEGAEEGETCAPHAGIPNAKSNEKNIL